MYAVMTRVNVKPDISAKHYKQLIHHLNADFIQNQDGSRSFKKKISRCCIYE